MSAEELQALRSELAALRGLVERLVATPQRPRAYEFREAARLLSVDAKTVSRMVRSGEVMTVAIRSKRLIPAEEIDRLVAPTSAKSSGATFQRLRLDKAKALKAIDAAMRR